MVVATAVGNDPEYTYANFTVSQNGLLAYQPAGATIGSRLGHPAKIRIADSKEACTVPIEKGRVYEVTPE